MLVSAESTGMRHFPSGPQRGHSTCGAVPGTAQRNKYQEDLGGDGEEQLQTARASRERKEKMRERLSWSQERSGMRWTEESNTALGKGVSWGRAERSPDKMLNSAASSAVASGKAKKRAPPRGR